MKLRQFKKTSASQRGTFKTCQRMWWLEKIVGLPTEDKDHFHYGTALHSIGERYFEADDAGRDKDGNPVELFPEDWHVVRYDRGPHKGKVAFRYNAVEQDHIRELVRLAIENGVWQRRSGREVEKSFEVLVPGTDINVVGYIDVFQPNQIDDHKTSKNSRYAMTSAKLAKDGQVLLYARMALAIAQQKGLPVPEEITVRHNIFLKQEEPGPRNPRAVEAVVTREAIEAEWASFIESTEDMVRVGKIKSLADVPWPDPKKGTGEDGACQKYGGCDFAGICGRQETIDQYRTRMDRMNAGRVERLNRQASTPEQKKAMSNVFDSFMKKKGGASATAKDTVNPEPKKAEIVEKGETPETTEVEAEVVEAAETENALTTEEFEALAAPWAVRGCIACGKSEHPGFNTKGNACKVCVKKSGVDMSEYAVNDFSWEPVAAAEEAPEEAPETPEEPEAPEAAEEPEAQEEAAKPAEEPEEAAAPEVGEPMDASELEKKPEKAPKKATAAAPPAKGAGRRRKGFKLLINASPLRVSPAKTILIDDVYRATREKLCEERGLKNFWEIDAFRRRDMLAAVADVIPDEFEFGTAWVIANTTNPDVRHFVEALIPYAECVIQGNG